MAIYTFLFLILQALLLEASAAGAVRDKRHDEITTDPYLRIYSSPTENPTVAYNPCHYNPCEHDCIEDYGYLRYRCRCRYGYILDEDGRSCLEARFPSPLLNCSINNGRCEHLCVMRMNSVRCYCRPGYTLLPDRMHCTRNTQKSPTGPVRGEMFDEMTTAIYPGMYLTITENPAVAYNPCRNNPCDHICINENWLFRCACRPGYVLDKDRKSCHVTFEYFRICRVPDIQNGDYGRYISGNFEKVTNADFIRNKEVLTLRCHKGYAPFPRQNNDSREGFFEGEIHCDYRTWSKNISCHSNSCSYVPRIKSDYTVNNEHQKRNHGDVITYAFWDDSTLIEKGKVKCHFGEWIGISTEFKGESITCSEFETSSGVEVSYTEGVSVGSYALFSCSSQNILEGESYAICLNNGTWSHSLPRCKESVTCKEFTSSPGLQISYSKGGSVGSRVSFSCLPPNVLSGTSYAICLSNGTWSHSSPSCTGPATCSEFQTSPGLQVSYSKGVSVGSKATFRCSPPDTLYGKSYAVCLVNGSWSSLPQCRESNTCSEFETLQGLEVKYTNNLSVGSKALFSCTPPSTLVGDLYAVCQNNRTWSHPLPSCEGVNGCYLKKPDSSSLLIDPEKENYSFGDIINLGCPPGYELTRVVERLMCLGKEWSDTLPDCKKYFYK